MNEEIMIPKMKRVDKTRKKFSIPWLNLVVIISCSLLIIASTFININIKHYIIPSNILSGKHLYAEDFIYSTFFIPQIPIIMFICSLLGKKMALSSTILYIVTGLFFIPIFALGGGPKYIAQHGFGYIAAYIPAIIIAGNFLKEKYSFPNMIKATLSGVLLIHLLGIIYMIIISLIKHTGADFISGWICAQSGIKIFYDLIASFILVLIGKYLHAGLMFTLEQ